MLVGPHAGKSTWDNITLTVDNPKALASFFRQVTSYGVSAEHIRASGSIESIQAAIVTGSQFDVTLGHREWNGKTYQDIKGVKPAAAPAVAALVVPPAPAVAAASGLVPPTVPQPVPAAPAPAVPPVVPAPVQPPAAPVAPAAPPAAVLF